MGSTLRLLPVLVLAAVAACGGKESPPPRVEIAEIVGLEGLEARIASHHGRPLIVNFWAIW